MLSRNSAVIVSLTSLFAGILLGIFLARGGPVVSAQVTSTGRAELAAATTSPTPVRQNVADEAIYDVLAKQYEQFRQVNRTFELVAKAVSPSVVHIVARKTTRPEESRRVRQFEETGSGVIIRSDHVPGLFVLTNHHVVDGSDHSKIRIFLSDGRSILPVKVWKDAKADVAVLKLGRDDLPAARLGNSDLAPIGTWVMALGSPFGLRHSVSQGIISARGRQMDELPDVVNQDFIQTDAAINPGNSGGPLVNMKGEVVGINNSIASNGGGNEGVGFSIPINLARWIMNELILHDGRVSRGALGVDLDHDFSQEKAVNLGMERPRGAWILTVHQSSPAAKAGMHSGDVVLRFGGIDVVDLNHLINIVSMATVGESAEVIVWRERQEVKLKVTVGDRERTLPTTTMPADPGLDPSGLVRRPNRPNLVPSFALGLELATLNAQLAQRFEIPESWRGALVVSVDAESPLIGIVLPADVISAIDNEVIQSSEQAVKILNQRADHGRSIISIDRLVNGVMERQTVRVP